MRRFFSSGFIAIGIVLLFSAFGLCLYNFYDDFRAGNSASDAEVVLESRLEEIEDTEYVDNRPLYERYPDMDMPTIEINGYRYIGTLEIPRFNLSLPVMEEWDYTRLDIAPCRYSGSAYKDNMVIAGHNYRTIFGQVHTLNSGDKVTFTDADGNLFKYHVIGIEVLDPTAIEEMTEKTEEDDWDLTIFTCTWGGRTRYAIRMEREK